MLCISPCHPINFVSQIEIGQLPNEIEQLPKLRCLDLRSISGFTADGLMSMLRRLKELEELSIVAGDQVTNAVLDELEPLQKLERLVTADDNRFTNNHRMFIQEKLKTMQILIA